MKIYNLFCNFKKVMRKFLCFLFPVIGFFIFSSCNKDEGLGGSSSVQGYVYNIVHRADNLAGDTIPAVEEKVYIIYGDNEDGPVADKRVETNQNGMYQFQYLRKGNYVVCAYSVYPEELNKEKVVELKHVKVGSGTAYADPIYIHSGKGYGLSMIRGKVMVQYYNRSYLPEGVPVPAVGERVYLKHFEGDTVFDDVRVSDQGLFIFDRVPPGVYEVYTTTEIVGIRNLTLPTPSQVVNVEKAHEIYELPEIFNIIINL